MAFRIILPNSYNMNLINYNLPLKFEHLPEGVIRYNKKIHGKEYWKYQPHAHFIEGVQVFDSNCRYCVGVPVYKRTPEEQAERQKQKFKYYEEWRKKKLEHELGFQSQHLKDI